MSNKIWGVILVLSLVIAGVSGYNVIKLSSEYRTGIEEYAALEEYVVVEETQVEEEPAVKEEVVVEKESQIPVLVDVRYEVLESTIIMLAWSYDFGSNNDYNILWNCSDFLKNSKNYCFFEYIMVYLQTQ